MTRPTHDRMDENKNMADIIKAAAFPIRDRKVLVVRKKKQDFYISLGGKNEKDEDDVACLLRETNEEIGCIPENIKHLATYEGPVHDDRTKTLKMTCYLCDLKGELKLNPNDNVVEYRWIGRDYAEQGIKVAHMLEHNIIPELIRRDLI